MWLLITAVLGLLAPPLASAQTARDSAEASVLRWLSRSDSTVIIRSTYDRGRICDSAEVVQPGTLGARMKEQGLYGCGVVNVPPIPAALRAAIANHDSLNPISTEIPARVLQLTGRRVVDSDSEADDGSCQGLQRLRATRVGLDSTLRWAALSYRFDRGHGPYPVCGGGGGATVYLWRHADDSWEVVETPVRWMS